MRRSRGGNTRKQKRELTDATFLSVIGGEVPSGLSGAAVVGEASADVGEVDEIDDDVVEATERRRYDDGQGLAPINGFVFSRFVLGTTNCTSCHCELIYYQDREILRRGFTFRCRVCQTAQMVTLAER